LSRLTLLGGVLGGTLIGAACSSAGGMVPTAGAQQTTAGANASSATLSAASRSGANLPVEEISEILKAQGTVSDGVFSFEIDREDITDVTIHGVPILPSFEINGGFFFQDLGGGRVAMNSDLALKPSEINPFIDQLLAHDIVFQAEHQHFYDFSPLAWFIHFRTVGKRDVHAVSANEPAEFDDPAPRRRDRQDTGRQTFDRCTRNSQLQRPP